MQIKITFLLEIPEGEINWGLLKSSRTQNWKLTDLREIETDLWRNSDHVGKDSIFRLQYQNK